jgi:hypothetical protein
MATIIYKKYFKKQPPQCEPSEHQQPVNIASEDRIELTTLPQQSPDGRVAEESHLQNVDKQISFGDTKTTSSIAKEDEKAMNRYRWKLVIGLFLPFFVQSLDLTIISGALPFIASDFRKY